MAISKTVQNTFRVEIFYPKDVRSKLNNSKQRFRKTVKTLSEAKQIEKEVKKQIQDIRNGKTTEKEEQLGNINFQKFVIEIWVPLYLSGSTGYTGRVPQQSTVRLTKRLFKNQIFPMFGAYTIDFLNQHKQFVLTTLVSFSQKFSNIKQICGYFNQVFEIAELLDYIEYNRISKVIKHVSQPRKQKLKQQREQKGASLSVTELHQWLSVINTDLSLGNLKFQDYVLFYLTLFIGDRKSESYALQWKNIDLKHNCIELVQSLDEKSHIKSTKGNKRTKIFISQSLTELLVKWKKEQKRYLKEIGLSQSPNQFLFTYTKANGELNQPVHPWYLNNRLKTLEKHHPKLRHIYPHLLRHTFATLAREGGATMNQISNSLTHSDISTTQLYVDTPNIVDLSTYNFFKKRLEQEMDLGVHPNSRTNG